MQNKSYLNKFKKKKILKILIVIYIWITNKNLYIKLQKNFRLIKSTYNKISIKVFIKII